MTDNLLTVKDVAQILNRSIPRVNAIAKQRNVGHRIGWQRVFTEADIEKLRPGKVGRPKHEKQN